MEGFYGELGKSYRVLSSFELGAGQLVIVHTYSIGACTENAHHVVEILQLWGMTLKLSFILALAVIVALTVYLYGKFTKFLVLILLVLITKIVNMPDLMYRSTFKIEILYMITLGLESSSTKYNPWICHFFLDTETVKRRKLKVY